MRAFAPLAPVLALALAALGCGGSGKEWVKNLPDENAPVPDPGWNNEPLDGRPPEGLPPEAPAERDAGARLEAPSDDGAAVRLTYSGNGASLADDLFRNTYYDFPREGGGAKGAVLFDAACAPIAPVTQTFHDQVCVQGSGRLTSGATVSFAKRGCSCAAMCPRTGQQICFEQLDPAAYPAGRGSTGHAITPLRTVAVDASVIPMGSMLFIPELAGLPKEDGSPHDGCFVAEDKGLRVQGRQVDVFTGDPKMTARWNRLFPSNKGVHVRLNEARCSR